MSRPPKPWYRKARKSWCVTIEGTFYNLGPNKKAAFDQFYKLMNSPRATLVSNLTFAALADRYLDWVQRKRAPDTYEWYRYRLERFCQKYPKILAADVRPHHVEAWVDDYDFSITSCRNYMRSVKRCLNWAVKQGLLESNPVAALEIPSGSHREVSLSQGEFEKLLRYIRNEQLRDLVITTWETGCRPQESLRVEARHVDLKHSRWLIPKSESKTKRMVRVVYLNERALDITRRLVERYPEGRLFRNTLGKPWTTEAVNCTFKMIRHRMGRDEMERQGLEVSEEQVREKIKSLSPVKRSGGKEVPKTATELKVEAKRKLVDRMCLDLTPNYSLYALRHAWATQALVKGVDPLTVAILMGHEDPSMLSKVYQHLALNPEHMLAEAVRATSQQKSDDAA